MTKEEMAQQFAEQNAEDVKEMLRRAFLKGYNQVALQTAHSISIDGVEYYDMGLPSGTLWSEPLEKEKGRYEMMPYIEASKYDGLPTIEQWEELKNTCMVHDNEIIGITGKRITIEFYVANSTYGCPPQRGEKVPDNEAWFWLKSEIDEEFAPDNKKSVHKTITSKDILTRDIKDTK